MKRFLIISVMIVLIFFVNSRLNSFERTNKNDYSFSYEIKKSEALVVENLVDFYEDNYELLEKFKEEKRIETERKKLKESIAKYAKRFVGNPYVKGGNSVINGTDCSGLVQLSYAHYGVTVPRMVKDLVKIGDEITDDEIEIGDLVFYTFDEETPTHVAIYIGNSRIVHASTPEHGIKISDMYSMPIYSIRKVI